MAYLADTVFPAPDSPLTMMDWFFSSLEGKEFWSVTGRGKVLLAARDSDGGEPDKRHLSGINVDNWVKSALPHRLTQALKIGEESRYEQGFQTA